VSEFLCACGNLIRPSVGVCELCGGRAKSMDGRSDDFDDWMMDEMWDEALEVWKRKESNV